MNDFFFRRESLKQTITGDKIGREKSKKSGTFLCAKKNTKKKKKKGPYSSNYNDGGYPIYHTSGDGEFLVLLVECLFHETHSRTFKNQD